MKDAFNHELRNLLPAWAGCVLLQLPAIILSPSDDGVPWHFGSFSVGCAGLVAYVFRPDPHARSSDGLKRADRVWRGRMAALCVALLAAVAAFSVMSLGLGNSFDGVALTKAVYVAALALCIVPWLMLVTRKFFASVVFSIMLVFLMKLLGCLVVVLVYGWDASERGYTTTPWTHPNLLVWFFWCSSAILSLSLYFLGKHRFRRISDDAIDRLPQPPAIQAAALEQAGR
jgi:hypothetical protein